MNVVKVMNGAAGRSAGAAAGLAVTGASLATGGAIPLLAGVARVCVAAPQLHAPLRA